MTDNIKCENGILTDVIGGATLFNGNCLDIMENIDVPVKLILTDPPYDVNSTTGGGSINGGDIILQNRLKRLIGDNGMCLGYDIARFAETVRKVQDGNVNIYLFCNKMQIPEYFNVYVYGMKCKYDVLTWHKTNPIPTFSNKYVVDTEYCLHFYRGKGATFPECYRDAFTYYISPINQKDKKKYNHPTIKPLEFVRRMVRNSSRPGDTVLDPFMGSGTTGVAALLEGRKFIGIELDDDFYGMSVRRISEEAMSKVTANGQDKDI